MLVIMSGLMVMVVLIMGMFLFPSLMVMGICMSVLMGMFMSVMGMLMFMGVGMSMLAHVFFSSKQQFLISVIILLYRVDELQDCLFDLTINFKGILPCLLI